MSDDTCGGPAAAWKIYVTNDNCPDYTWGYTEEQTSRALADLVAAHLDEMARTDSAPPDNRDCYNLAITREALSLLQHHPEREAELAGRLREGRLTLSPFLCNTLWGLQSVEGVLRAFYPARRLQRRWGVSLEVAEHTEAPSLPWGLASLLAACGVRWLVVPFLSYDSGFAELDCPPAFELQGPDGGTVRVVMDPWACNRAHYTQGARLLADLDLLEREWLPHYAALGEVYPVRTVLASGTHGDIAPESGQRAREFSEAIAAANARPGDHPRLVNATLTRFCEALDEAEAARPFLRPVRGCFGHAWEAWAVSLAAYAAAWRQGERDFLAAETLLALGAADDPRAAAATAEGRERAEWCLAMLADHAWNGTDEANQRHNAALRRGWSEELGTLARQLTAAGWAGLGLRPVAGRLTLCNTLSVPRAGLVRLDPAPAACPHTLDGEALPAQTVPEAGRPVLYFVSPQVPGYGLAPLHLSPSPERPASAATLRARPDSLESPLYRLTVDPASGTITSLQYKPLGLEVLAEREGRGLCETIYDDGAEHTLTGAACEVEAEGPVLARLRISGRVADASVALRVSVYAELDRVDFEVCLRKSPGVGEQRVCQVFPVLLPGAVLRVETPGAVVRPRPQPHGDLLPGAEVRRYACQGFVDASVPGGPGVTVSPLDAFLLRLDLPDLAFEALGNDQNYREVLRDQDGVTEFRFRYALRVHAGDYCGPEAFAWSRCVGTPLLAAAGAPADSGETAAVAVEPGRAVATCLKPADGDEPGVILRLWETAGQSGPLLLGLSGFRRAVRCDLLERDLEELPVVAGQTGVPLAAHGFAAARLLR